MESDIKTDIFYKAYSKENSYNKKVDTESDKNIFYKSGLTFLDTDENSPSAIFVSTTPIKRNLLENTESSHINKRIMDMHKNILRTNFIQNETHITDTSSTTNTTNTTNTHNTHNTHNTTSTNNSEYQSGGGKYTTETRDIPINYSESSFYMSPYNYKEHGYISDTSSYSSNSSNTSSSYISSDYTSSDYTSSNYTSSDYTSSNYTSSDYTSSNYTSSDYTSSSIPTSSYYTEYSISSIQKPIKKTINKKQISTKDNNKKQISTKDNNKKQNNTKDNNKKQTNKKKQINKKK